MYIASRKRRHEGEVVLVQGALVSIHVREWKQGRQTHTPRSIITDSKKKKKNDRPQPCPPVRKAATIRLMAALTAGGRRCHPSISFEKKANQARGNPTRPRVRVACVQSMWSGCLEMRTVCGVDADDTLSTGFAKDTNSRVKPRRVLIPNETSQRSRNGWRTISSRDDTDGGSHNGKSCTTDCPIIFRISFAEGKPNEG